MNQFIQELQQSLTDDTFLQLVLSRPVHRAAGEIQKVVLRPVVLKSGRSLQASLTNGPQETHRNLAVSDAVAAVVVWFGSQFQEADLFTQQADLRATFKASGDVRCVRRPPSKTRSKAPSAHNRAKRYLIPEGVPCPFLIEMGVMTPDGKVRAAKYDKFRQVNRFLELVDDVLPELPQTGLLRVVDFGCGKSYLTFALHHLLTAIHRREVEIVGLDLKSDVIEHCKTVAMQLHCEGLSFRVGDIATHETSFPVDLTVSLHACNTATDAAIARAVQWQSRVILCVPCCQHEFAAQMHCELLRPLLRHGILKERFAALATDAMRAQVLEILGYGTQVIEFIDLEHTPKNLMLRAVRRAAATPTPERLIEDWRAFKAELGLHETALESLLNASGVDGLEIGQLTQSSHVSKSPIPQTV